MDVTQIACADAAGEPSRRLSVAANRLIGSEILKIAADIRELTRAGADICNLTVGDFSPQQFAIPARLRDGISAALAEGETNYPPSNGILPLRAALVRFYERELGLRYPIDSVLVASGARPLIYGTFRAVVDPGDTVVYPVPSWNNNHYATMLDARGVALLCDQAQLFLPSAAQIIDHLPAARLLCLCSPQNPTGTVISRDALSGVCEAVLAENRAREASGQKPVYLLYDHIYWQLCYGEARHYTPVGLAPEMARYTVFIDGISKAFAATGLRVGWALGPVDVIARMTKALGHVGAWAPRPEQLATTALLDDDDAISSYHREFAAALQARLELLHRGVSALRAEGLPVDSIPPMGAIYLTVRIAPFGAKTPEGRVLTTNEDIRQYLLQAAGLGVVPFQAFGYPGDTGLFRLSVGAVGLDEIERMLPRLGVALRALTPAA